MSSYQLFLASLCQDLRNTCEKVYENVLEYLPGGERPSARRGTGEYEKLRRDERLEGAHVSETMDREIATELVELAVSGVKHEKSARPGGDSFSAPIGGDNLAKPIASESLKELTASVQSLGRPSAKEQLQYCRDLENKIHSKLRFFRDIDSAIDTDEPIYLVNARWFEEWSNFLRGAQRPGKIVNKDVNQLTGKWGQSFIGLDAKGWGILSELYKFDKEVLFELPPE